MEINFMMIFFNLINIVLYILIVVAVISAFKKAKKFINEIKTMHKKIDEISEKLEK